MIGFLRFIGLVNAAVWLGASVFFALAARPALFSPEMVALLQPKNHPYFSGAIENVLSESYYHFVMACAIIAVLHQTARWLYLGRPSRKTSFGLVAVLFVLVLINGNAVQPQLKRFHTARFAANVQAVERQKAAKSFRTWRAVHTSLNLLMIGGVLVHLWRVANPSDSLRFISSVKFRG